tara:strand:+ start:2507 stop:3181 length:675 start_codon:yes stop_codon:yes gene_type:complete
MEVIRVIKNKDYTIISNKLFKDRDLSLKAKGLLALLLSLSDNWKLSISGLNSILKEGHRSIRSTINELIEYKYMHRYQVREDGKILYWNYIVYENPQLHVHNVHEANVDEQNDILYNTKEINNQLNKDQLKKQFFNEVMNFKEYNKETLKSFYNYWSEQNKKMVMKKDLQKTWSTRGRLSTWIKNETKWALKSVGMSKVEKHLQSHEDAMNILKQIEQNDQRLQ